jgi:putative SOS response-associated peptidase YedK
MCGRFTLKAPPDVLARQFEIGDIPDLVPRYNIAPTQDAPVVRMGRREAPREMTMMRWGLLPPWSKDIRDGARLINARIETASSSAAFKDAYAKRRCLVPADGFYEWHTSGGVKQPYWIHPADGSVMALGGLWERWKNPDGQWLLSFCILTTDANEYVATLHDRMPVVVPVTSYEDWLDARVRTPADVERLLQPLDPAYYEADPVSLRVNKPENDDAELLTPTGPALAHL